MKRHILNRSVAVLLAVLVLLSFVRAADPVEVNAASKITLKSGAAAPSTIYAGKNYNLKVAGKSVKFTTSNKKVATIGATTGKLKALGPGTVKITAKDKKTGKAVASKTFTVLQRAKSVASDPSEIYLTEIGETFTVKASLTPSNSTDVIRFTSSDKTVVTVGATSGKITAKGCGTAIITIYAKANKATSNSNKANKTATVKVFVIDAPAKEKALVYFDAGDIGILNSDAAWKILEKGSPLGDLPTLDDIELIVPDEYELVGWTTNPFSEGTNSHVMGPVQPLVDSSTKVNQDMDLYAVWKNAEKSK